MYLVRDRQLRVHPGGGDLARQLDAAAVAAHDDGEHELIGQARAHHGTDEDEVGEAVAVDVAHAARGTTHVGAHDQVGLRGHVGDLSEVDRSEQEIAGADAGHQQLAHAIAVEVGNAHGARETLVLRRAQQRERVAHAQIVVVGQVHAGRRLRHESRRGRRSEIEAEQLARSSA